ncbi:ATP synthase subunit I [Filifactor alocis]|uniref:ATP synthase subunit I n=1 Tax=Filifactor alocis TaxID=143361 RepID=UPI003F9F7A14
MQTIMLAIAVSIMVFFFTNSGRKMILGIFLGTFISLLNFRQMALGFEKAVRMEETRAKRYATIQYMIRFFIVGAVLVLSARSPYVNVPGVVIGLFLLKVVILGSNFLKFIFRNSIF